MPSDLEKERTTQRMTGRPVSAADYQIDPSIEQMLQQLRAVAGLPQMGAPAGMDWLRQLLMGGGQQPLPLGQGMSPMGLGPSMGNMGGSPLLPMLAVIQALLGQQGQGR